MMEICKTDKAITIGGFKLPSTFDAENLEVLASSLLELPQVECPIIHHFGPGVYAREATMPAGSLVVGHYHRFEHLNVFLKGHLTMFNENGSTTDMKAPIIFNSPPGQKCAFIHEEAVWMNVYSTDETDVETLEKTYLDKDRSPSWNKWDDILNNQSNRLPDINDYKNLITSLGFTEEAIRLEVEKETDQIAMPLGDYKAMVSKSQIEGKGVFATANIKKGEIIGPANIEGKRTPFGRYCNHARYPNAKMVFCGDNINMVAIKSITGCKGGFVGEEITTNYIKNLQLGGDIWVE